LQYLHIAAYEKRESKHRIFEEMKKVSIVALLVLMFPTLVSGLEYTDDPWEKWNRKVYKFNRIVDLKIASPVATAYVSISPKIVQQGLRNFFTNLDDVPTVINSLLQGKLKNSASDFGRLLVNSSIGIAGFWDPASRIGLVKHQEDFGQTLGVWGIPSGPYVMLPLLGPSTVRGLASYAEYPDYDLLNNIDHTSTRRILKSLKLIGYRVEFAKYDDLLGGSLDEYVFIRDAYLQSRTYQVFDGNINDDCENFGDEAGFPCEF